MQGKTMSTLEKHLDASIFERFKLEGKVAIITGGTRGIGLAMAEALCDAGAKVVVSSRKQEGVDGAVEALKTRKSGEVHGVAAHVGKAEDRKRLVAETVSHFGGVDILINNAGTNVVFGSSLYVEEPAWDKIMQINLKAPFELSKLVHPHMAERKGGAILNVSSIGGVSPEPGLGVYSVSKAGLVSLTKVLANEWGADNIRANVICPGLVKTKFARTLWENPDIAEQAVGGQPIDRVATPDEMAGLALFLVSDASSYCTGGVYMADGGHTI
jgi:NAD(P)-dependent dehydrogenase (short-subunit alcohol dehydrogenase family)